RLTELEFLRRSVRSSADIADTLIRYIRIPEVRQ
ncbi:MAG TPA: ATP-binding protein, partial [Bacteroides sp.]|nr:ATP-binding protein [Bacteroides sp.]